MTQAAVDKVIRSVPRSAIIDGDHSATLHLDLETCRLVRLPVAWYEFAASAALSPGACHAMLEARVVLRCVFGRAHHSSLSARASSCRSYSR